MDSFDDLQCEDTAGYEAYQAQLEYQQWLQERSIDDINAEIQLIVERESVDFNN